MDVFYQIKVRYFKPLVYKEKALVRKHRGFLFLARAEIAQARDKNKKTRQTPKVDAGILTWSVTPRGS
jgi:hypothetical protein